MNQPNLISGQKIVDIVKDHPRGIKLSYLFAIATRRFGANVSFHTSCLIGLEFEEILIYLEAHERIVITDEVVSPPSAFTAAD